MEHFYLISVWLMIGFAILVFFLLLFITAPYGKFSRGGWGFTVKARWAWLIMESPSPVLMTLFFISAPQKTLLLCIFLTFWLLHYIYRTFFYPFFQKGMEKQYPVLLVAMAFIFNILNGTANGFGVFHLYHYEVSWFHSWQFIIGAFVFITGFVINKIADDKLRRLKTESGGKYVIPRGWLFEYISSPHFFGEIVEWGGWAIMTWSVPGLAFFVFTFANLFPRAIASHKWYKKEFPNYPVKRKAVIPFVI